MLEFGKVKKVCHVAHGKEWELQILLIFYSYHVTDHPISLFEFYITSKNHPLPLSSTSYPMLLHSHSTPPVFFNLSHKVKSKYQISLAPTITILTYIIYSQNIYTFLIWTCLFLQLGVRKKERKWRFISCVLIMHHRIWMLGSLFLLYKA